MTRATAARIGEDWDTYVAARAAQIPVARAGQVEDIAHAVSFFVSEGAGFVSGQVLYVAGGPQGMTGALDTGSVRFIFRPPAAHAAGLLTLPWDVPLEEWVTTGCSRWRTGASRATWCGSSRSTAWCSRSRRSTSGWPGASTACSASWRPWACPRSRCSGSASSAHRSTGTTRTRCWSRASSTTRCPTATSSPTGTRATPPTSSSTRMVELLARLHLAGLYWGDCSLSNTLFRPDAGTIAAYLVDAETAEMHPTLSDGQRHGDIDYAAERVGGELFDLQDGGLLPADVDPIVVALRAAAALPRAVGRADPRGGLPPRRAALPRRGARRAAQPARLRRRRAGAPHHRRRHPAPRPHAGGRDRARPPSAVRAHRAGGHREPGAAAAQRRRQLPRLPGAEGGQAGAGDAWPRTAGAPRSTTGAWPWCPTTSTTASRPRRSSTRSSNTGGSCPSRRAPTSARPQRRRPTSGRSCPRSRAPSTGAARRRTSRTDRPRSGRAVGQRDMPHAGIGSPEPTVISLSLVLTTSTPSGARKAISDRVGECPISTSPCARRGTSHCHGDVSGVDFPPSSWCCRSTARRT